MSASAACRSAPSWIFTEIALTARALACVTPMTFFLAVLIGISTTSSWSWPQLDWPLRSSTPTTTNGTFRIRTICPMGSVPPNRLSTTVWPTRATFAAPSTSSGPKYFPSAAGHSRTIW